MIETELSTNLLELLVCPLTKGPLEYDKENNELISKEIESNEDKSSNES